MDISELLKLEGSARKTAPRSDPPEPAGDAAAGATSFDPTSLGAALRNARKEKGLTLNDVSDKAGISLSTLSRVETGQLTLSFERAHVLAEVLGIPFTRLMAETREQVVTTPQGWRSVSRAGEGRVVETANFTYRYVCTDMMYRNLVTIFGVPKARTLEEHGPLVSHEGEEFTHVLAGSIYLITEPYEPLLLTTGDCIQFDASTPHAILRTGDVEPLLMGCMYDPRNTFR
jgi:DNA-binding XRE family transcriptional regulator